MTLHRKTPTGRTTPAPGIAEFRAAVLEGLGVPRKTLPAKYFYDAEGSRLFDEICTLEAYYPTRTELGILSAHAGDVARAAGPGTKLVEFGAGSLVKVRVLLDALDAPAAYIPIDISANHLITASGELARDYPNLRVAPVVGDFTRKLTLPRLPGDRTLGFFPGSTIGNFTPTEAQGFLSEAGSTLGPEALLVLGVDLRKDVARLEAAYNDTQGITAAFNLNILARINRELEGTFDLAQFAHHAFFNAEQSRIEMHIMSRRDQQVHVAGQTFMFASGETIHTENSYKYAPDEIAALALRADWHVREIWTGAEHLFGVFLLSRT